MTFNTLKREEEGHIGGGILKFAHIAPVKTEQSSNSFTAYYNWPFSFGNGQLFKAKVYAPTNFGIFNVFTHTGSLSGTEVSGSTSTFSFTNRYSPSVEGANIKVTRTGSAEPLGGMDIWQIFQG